MKDNQQIVSVILSFPSTKKRSKFFASNCLEKFGVAEKTMGSTTDCSIDNMKAIDISKIVAFAKKNYNADYYLDCGGKSLNDCSEHERKCGSVCNYCQYCEFN